MPGWGIMPALSVAGFCMLLSRAKGSRPARGRPGLRPAWAGLPLLALGLVPPARSADTAAPARPEPPQVTIVGTALPAAASDALVQVIGREELTRYGDRTLQDALRRVPGLNVDVDGRLQLRGLGRGYTQVLLDGRPLGTQGDGPVLDDLDLAAIERVEIVRGRTASDGGEGIAGTVRVITRQAGGPARRSTTVELQAGHERLSPTIGVDLADRLSPQLSGQAALRWQREASTRARRVHSQWVSDYGGVVYTDQTQRSQGERSQSRLNGSGALAWQDDTDRLALGLLAVGGPVRSSERSRRRTQSFDGSATQVSEDTQTVHDDEPGSWHLEPNAQWRHRLDDGATLQAQWSGSRAFSHSRWQLRTEDDTGEVTDDEGEDSRDTETTQRLALGWDRPLGHGARLSLGGQTLREQRANDTRADGETERDRLRRRTRALHVQAHWQAEAAWQLEAGWRQEHGELELNGQTLRQYDLGLPSLAATGPLAADLQWHAGLSRSDRQPRLRDLSPGGRSTGSYNQPWYPDVRGNPGLRNETADGLDVGLTGQRGPLQWALNAYARRIDQAIVFRVAQGDDGRWVLSPANLGRAQAQGLEARGEIDLSELSADSPWHLPLTLRADLSLHQSHVDGLPSPSRLPGQAPLQLNLGGDARPGGAFSAGATLHYEAPFASRALPSTTFTPGTGTANDSSTRVVQAAQCTLDAYALWALDGGQRLRLRASQLGRDWRAASSQRQQLGRWDTRFRGSRDWAVALSLEQDW